MKPPYTLEDVPEDIRKAALDYISETNKLDSDVNSVFRLVSKNRKRTEKALMVVFRAEQVRTLAPLMVMLLTQEHGLSIRGACGVVALLTGYHSRTVQKFYYSRNV